MDFAVSVIHLVAPEIAAESIISVQIALQRSSIGANIREAQYANSSEQTLFQVPDRAERSQRDRLLRELLFRTNYISEAEPALYSHPRGC